MVQVVSRRTGFTGSTLVRLLARLTEVDATESPQVLAERLGHWLGWAEAVPLSAALNRGTGPQPAPAEGTWAPDAAHAARVRAGLARDIAQDGRAPVRRARLPAMRGAVAAEPMPDFAAFRRRYQMRQQALENGIEPLREQLRAQLAAASPAQGRLAAVDAVMARVLGLQERQWLAGVPALLEKHFERLRRAAAEAPNGADAGTPPGEAPAWVRRFEQDMQHVLLAELEFRWQPIEGLLAALGTTTRQELHD